MTKHRKVRSRLLCAISNIEHTIQMKSSLFFEIAHLPTAVARSFLNQFRPIKAQCVENFTTYIVKVIIDAYDTTAARGTRYTVQNTFHSTTDFHEQLGG